MFATYFLYTAIFVLAAFFAYIAQHGISVSQRMWARIFCFMCLFVPAALRYGIGVDYNTYCSLYDNNFPLYMQQLEPGFVFVGRFCRMLGLSSVMYMAVISGVTYALICFCALRKHIFTIIVFYILSFIYLLSYDIVRQCMATSILLCGFSLFYSNHKIKGFFLFAIASLIHYSSLVAIPIIIFSFLNINIWLRFSMVAVFILIATNENILRWLISIVTFINPRNAHLYMTLINTKIKTGVTIIIMAFPSLLILLNSEKISKFYNGKFILNVNAIYLTTCILMFIVAIFTRFMTALFFIPLFSIQILYTANKRYAKLYHSFLLVLFFALFVRQIELNTIYMVDRGSNRIAPYNSIFNR